MYFIHSFRWTYGCLCYSATDFRRMFRLRCVLTCLIMCVGVTAAVIEQEGTFHPEEKSWTDAEAVCRNTEGGLFVPKASLSAEILEKIIPDTAEAVWIGKYSTPWISYTGCFVMNNSRTYQENNFSFNQPTVCATACKDAGFIGLQGQRCFCIKNTDNFIPAIPRDCDITCPGNDDGYCGGSASFTIYQLVDLGNDTTDDITKNCLAVGRNGSDISLFQAHCNEKLNFACRSTIVTAEGNRIYEFMDPDQRTTWQSARSKCRTCQNCNGLADLAHLNIGNGQTLWTQWSRNTSCVHHGDRQPTPKRCFALQKDNRTGYSKVVLDCALPRPFICQSEQQKQTEQMDTSRETPSKGGLYVGVTVAATCIVLVAGLVGFVVIKRRQQTRKIQMSTEASQGIYSEDFSADSSFVNENYAPYINMEHEREDNVEPAKEATNTSHVYIEFSNETDKQSDQTDVCAIDGDKSDDKVEYENKPNPTASEEKYENASVVTNEEQVSIDNYGDRHEKSTDQNPDQAYATIEEDENYLIGNVTCNMSSSTENEYERVELPQTNENSRSSKSGTGCNPNSLNESKDTAKRESFYDLIDDKEIDMKSDVQYACINKTPTIPTLQEETGNENDITPNCGGSVLRQSITVTQADATYTDFDKV